MSKAPRRPTESELLDLSGQVLGEYHLLRKLGQGGMGHVYLAKQTSLRREVAVKLLRPDLASSPQALARFKLEAESVARATHPNIVQVYAYGQTDGYYYMALEYVEGGRTLKDLIKKKGPPEIVLGLSIMRQVAAALTRAGELGIIHRDIKPDNILLTKKGEVKVADFGLSSCKDDGNHPPLNLTQSGVTMGTPLYMSPEQVEGKKVDVRSDIYSFGVTCYHMFTGEPPFRGETAFEVAIAHVQRQPRPLRDFRPDLPEGLCAIVHRMMAKSIEDRYQSARDLLRDIVRLRESLNGTTQGTGGMPSIQVEPALLNTILPPDPTPVPMGKGSQTQITSPPALAPSPVPLTPRFPWGVMMGLVVLSLMIATVGGAAYGWRERQTEGPLPYGEDLRPADAIASERILRPSMREKTLRAAAEQYLAAGKIQDQRGGQGICADLGLFYLDAGRIEEANALFQRLEKFRSPLEFQRLGQLGRGIILALEHKPKESNQLLRDVFTMYNPKSKSKDKGLLDKFDKMAAGKKFEQQIGPLRTILSHPRWLYYLARARYLNHLNGLKDEDMPPMFVMRIQELDGPRKK